MCQQNSIAVCPFLIPSMNGNMISNNELSELASFFTGSYESGSYECGIMRAMRAPRPENGDEMLAVWKRDAEVCACR